MSEPVGLTKFVVEEGAINGPKAAAVSISKSSEVPMATSVGQLVF